MRLRTLVSERPLSVAAAVGWAAITLATSVVSPPPGAAELSGAGPLGPVGADKWLHALAYGTLAVLVAAALRASARRELLAAVLVSAGFGAAVEAIQLAVPARSGDPVDALANAAGAAVAVALWYAGVRILTPAGSE